MDQLPIIGVEYMGLPISAAPKHLAPFLDTATGAVIWQGGEHSQRRMTICRDNEVVGEVALDGDYRPIVQLLRD